MKLTIGEYPVEKVLWGDGILYREGCLTLCRNLILDHLQEQGDLRELEITTMEVVNPRTSTRVINVFDVLPAHARLGIGAHQYPGLLDAQQTVGNGDSACLSRFSLLAISSLPSRYNKVLDKAGIGVDISPYGEHGHLAFRAVPRDPGMKPSEYYRQLKKIGLRIGTYLAKSVAAEPPPHKSVYTLPPCPQGMPRVAYVCMLASLQNWDKGEAILYGNDLAGMLPTILHPNELLDGAAIAQNFNLGIDTYSIVNNPVIKGLYRRHGTEIDFAGVIACVSNVDRKQRECSVQMTTKLAVDILEANLVIITKVGGGIPESDVMLTIESLEGSGVKTSGVMWAHMGDGSMQDLLTAYSPAADALASVGVNDAWAHLPEQEQVLGGTQIEPLSDDPEDKPQPAHEAIRVRYRDICGAISQLGASRVAMTEI